MKPRKFAPTRCARCGVEDPKTTHYSDVVDFKGLTLEVDGLTQTICGKCGFIWTTPGQELDNLGVLKAAFVEERDRARAELGLLSGEQIASALEQLQLSKSEAAALFGGGPNAFTKYINGEVLQSIPMDRLLRLTVGFGKFAVEYLRKAPSAPPIYGAALINFPTTVTTSQGLPPTEVKFASGGAPATVRFVRSGSSGASVNRRVMGG